MSTRSLIGKQNNDGSITYIYCHYDGYLEHNGKVLKTYYTDEETVDKLLALGDMSSLGTRPVPGKDFEDFSEDVCLPYSLRDEDVPARTVKNESEYLETFADSWCDFCYLFKTDGSDCGWVYISDDSDSGWTPIPDLE